MQVGWRPLKGKKYYLGTDGIMKTGKQTIEGKVYYFNTDGVMQTGWITIKGKDCYFDPKTGAYDSSKKRKLTELEKKCASIVNAKTTSADSEMSKLNKLFHYTVNQFSYYRKYVPAPSGNEWKTWALNMFRDGYGNCFNYAAAFGFLAKKATGYPVRLVSGRVPSNSGGLTPHGWCEVQINGTWRVFDPDMYKFDANSRPAYYNASPYSGFYYPSAYYTITSF